MRFILRRTALVLATGSLVFFLSCERHHVGELHGDQHADPHAEHKADAPPERHDSKTDQSQATTHHSHTAQTPAPPNSPANFFPDKPKP
ncbi:MAG TPA: hypothetical protein VM940_11060 [Chthoniobacterales bacterium]|nr:hypothetical protein [Chthoniobacterales bacterium]